MLVGMFGIFVAVICVSVSGTVSSPPHQECLDISLNV